MTWIAGSLVLLFSTKPPALGEGAARSAGKDSQVVQHRPRLDYASLPLSFEPNQGQTDSRVKFLSRGPGYTVFLTAEEAVLAFHKKDQAPSGGQAVLRVGLAGANRSPRLVGLNPLAARSNYFIGKDPRRWQTGIPIYGKVQYQNVYPGVDLVYYGNRRHLEYDFVVSPGADPRAIRLVIAEDGRRDGPSHRLLQMGDLGDLIVKGGDGQVRFHKPVVYQTTEKRTRFIEGGYVLRRGHEVTFRLGDYDRTKPLIIDPVLAYSTYLGGTGLDTGNGIAVDSSGSAYVTGETASADFPATPGSYQPNIVGISNAFVTKFDSSGTLVYSTYIGGSLADRGAGIAVDGSGNAYIAGRTDSEDFPTVNAFQPQLLGDFDAVISELGPQGDTLLYSSYLGGSGNDAAFGIAVDGWGHAYITGGAGIGSQDDFPITPGAYQRVYGGGMNDAFAAKFDPTQSGLDSLIYSTFLGGMGRERGNSIAVDGDGNSYVTGRTDSSDFPLQNALQPAYGGGLFDAFIVKLNSAATDAFYSTFLGGSSSDQGYGIAVDSAGNAYVAGETDSGDFPIVSGFQTSGGGDLDAFVAQIDPAGASILYSTYLGGSGADSGDGISVDASGVAYVTGRTSSASDFPTTPDAIQPAFGGGQNDAFVTKIDPSQMNAGSLVYSSYLGGSGDENPPSVGPSGNPSGGIAVDSWGNIFVAGGTTSTDFPTQNSSQPSYGGGQSDAFVIEIGAETGLHIVNARRTRMASESAYRK